MNKTKLKILTGAGEMFAENSFNGTALDTLLGSVKVSKGSFFHFFRSKDDFLLEFLDFESKKLFSKLGELLEQNANPLLALYSFMNWRQNNYQQTGRLISKLGSEMGSQNSKVQRKIKKIYGDYLSYLIQILKTSKRKGQLIQSAPIKELANFILFSLEGGSMSMSLTENEDQYNYVIDMIKRVVRSYRKIDDVSESWNL
ncbi:TetR family transcriptional regulator [Candidatus Dojkabacteria bacterium]|nr:TetR family transcriptional regulator [Candidatus Dojkabacteria bacterium]